MHNYTGGVRYFLPTDLRSVLHAMVGWLLFNDTFLRRSGVGVGGEEGYICPTGVSEGGDVCHSTGNEGVDPSERYEQHSMSLARARASPPYWYHCAVVESLLGQSHPRSMACGNRFGKRGRSIWGRGCASMYGDCCCCCCCFSHSAYWLPTRKNYFTRWPIPLVVC